MHGFIRVRVNAALGITAAFLAVVVLGADEHAQFAFHDAVVLVGVFDDLACRLRHFFRTAHGCRRSSRW